MKEQEKKEGWEEDIQQEVRKDGMMYKSYWYIKALKAEEIVQSALSSDRERIRKGVEGMRNVVDKDGVRVTTDGFVDTVVSLINPKED
jgi:hypothetical protein